MIIWVSSSCMCGCMCARNRSLWVCGQWQKHFGSIIALFSGQLVCRMYSVGCITSSLAGCFSLFATKEWLIVPCKLSPLCICGESLEELGSEFSSINHYHQNGSCMWSLEVGFHRKKAQIFTNKS